MRKHGRNGTETTVKNRFWIRHEGQTQERRRTSLSFEADRASCCWSTASSRPRIIKH